MRTRGAWIIAIGVVALVASACSGGGGNTRVVLVDFSHDEFATFIARNFPGRVTVTQGQTLEFHQTWTGEPHTVTGGVAITDKLKPATAWLAVFENYDAMRSAGVDLVDPEDPGDATWADFAGKLKAAKDHERRDKFLAAWRALRASGVPIPDVDIPPSMPAADGLKAVDEASNKAFEGLLFIDSGEDGKSFQNVAQPCFTRELPEPAEQPCSKAQRAQPAFNGKQGYYNSGVLPYEGSRGNTYKVRIADDAVPGTYLFYCAVHGPLQRTEVEIKKRGASIPSQGEVSRQARREIDEVVDPMRKTFEKARKTGAVEMDGRAVKGPFAGLPTDTEASINEFVPKRMTVKANEPVTWRIIGRHTISFRVPKYLPIIDFGKPKIEVNPKVSDPTRAPKPPEQGEDAHGVQKFDAGTYDGTGFWSSGQVGADPYLEYTLRISKPGTYQYACLVHPPMVGTIVVTAA